MFSPPSSYSDNNISFLWQSHKKKSLSYFQYNLWSVPVCSLTWMLPGKLLCLLRWGCPQSGYCRGFQVVRPFHSSESSPHPNLQWAALLAPASYCKDRPGRYHYKRKLNNSSKTVYLIPVCVIFFSLLFFLVLMNNCIHLFTFSGETADCYNININIYRTRNRYDHFQWSDLFKISNMAIIKINWILHQR